MTWKFLDNDDESELENDSEPNFTFYNFSKWLGEQKKGKESDSLKESINPIPQISKDELKETFKQNIIKKVQDKVKKRIKKNRSKKD